MTRQLKKQVKVSIEQELADMLSTFVTHTEYTQSDVLNMLLRDFFYDKDTTKILRAMLL